MIIVKIGGGAQINVDAIAKDLTTINQPMIIVHGANALRNQLAQQLGIDIQQVTSLSGYTSVFSDSKLIDVMMMSYAGLANKSLISALQQQGINALGLTGLDGQLIKGKRNSGIRTRVNGKKVLRRDQSGKPFEINTSLLSLLLDQGYVPVITVPIMDQHGHAINSENDDIVALLQQSFKAERVIQLIEAPGLLENYHDQESLIERLTAQQLFDWEKRTKGRMRRKLLALGKMFRDARPIVHIADGRTNAPISGALEGLGTVIQ